MPSAAPFENKSAPPPGHASARPLRRVFGGGRRVHTMRKFPSSRRPNCPASLRLPANRNLFHPVIAFSFSGLRKM